MNEVNNLAKGEPQELLAVQPEEIISSGDSEDFTLVIDRLEKSVEAFNRIKTIAIRLTNELDWVDMGGRPYLLESGAQKIAKAFGVEVFDVALEQQRIKDEKGEYTVFLARGKARSKTLNSYVEDIGTCSQRDKFFAMRGGELVPVEDVDITMIMKKAVANLYGRLIKRVVGFGNVTWEELRAGNVKPAAKVEYKKRVSEKAKAIGDMLLEMAGGDKDAASALLQEYSRFKDKDGKEHCARSIADLSDAWAEKLLPKIQKVYTEFQNSLGGGVEK